MPTEMIRKHCSPDLMKHSTAMASAAANNIIKVCETFDTEGAKLTTDITALSKDPPSQVLQRLLNLEPAFLGLTSCASQFNGYVWLQLCLQCIPSQQPAFLYKNKGAESHSCSGQEADMRLGMHVAHMMCNIVQAASRSQLQELLLCLLQLAVSRRCHPDVAEGSAIALHIIITKTEGHRVQLILAQPRSQELLQVATESSSAAISSTASSILLRLWHHMDLEGDAGAAAPSYAATLQKAAATTAMYCGHSGPAQLCWLVSKHYSWARMLGNNSGALVEAGALTASPCQLFSLAAVCNLCTGLLEHGWQPPADWPALLVAWVYGNRLSTAGTVENTTAVTVESDSVLHQAADVLQFALGALASFPSHRQLAAAAFDALSLAVQCSLPALLQSALTLLHQRMQQQQQQQQGAEQHATLAQLLLQCAPDPATYPHPGSSSDGQCCRDDLPYFVHVCKLWSQLVTAAPATVQQAVAEQVLQDLQHGSSSNGWASTSSGSNTNRESPGFQHAGTSIDGSALDCAGIAAVTGLGTKPSQQAGKSTYDRSSSASDKAVLLALSLLSEVHGSTKQALLKAIGQATAQPPAEVKSWVAHLAGPTTACSDAASIQEQLNAALAGSSKEMLLLLKACKDSQEHRQQLLQRIHDVVAVVASAAAQQLSKQQDQAQQAALAFSVALLCQLSKEHEDAVQAACWQLAQFLQDWIISTDSTATDSTPFEPQQAEPDAPATAAFNAAEQALGEELFIPAAPAACAIEATAFLQCLFSCNRADQAGCLAVAVQHFAVKAPVPFLAALLHNCCEAGSTCSSTLSMAVLCVAGAPGAKRAFASLALAAPAPMLRMLIAALLRLVVDKGSSSAKSQAAAVDVLFLTVHQLTVSSQRNRRALLGSIVAEPPVWDMVMDIALHNRIGQRYATSAVFPLLWKYVQQPVQPHIAKALPELMHAVLHEADQGAARVMRVVIENAQGTFVQQHLLPYISALLAAIQPGNQQAVQSAAWGLLAAGIASPWAEDCAAEIVEQDGVAFLLDMLLQSSSRTDQGDAVAAIAAAEASAVVVPEVAASLISVAAKAEHTEADMVDAAAQSAVDMLRHLGACLAVQEVLMAAPNMRKLLLAAVPPALRPSTTVGVNSSYNIASGAGRGRWHRSIAEQALDTVEVLTLSHEAALPVLQQHFDLLLIAVKQQQCHTVSEKAGELLLDLARTDEGVLLLCSSPQHIRDLFNLMDRSNTTTVPIELAAILAGSAPGRMLLADQYYFDSLVTATQNNALAVAQYAVTAVAAVMEVVCGTGPPSTGGAEGQQPGTGQQDGQGQMLEAGHQQDQLSAGTEEAGVAPAALVVIKDWHVQHLAIAAQRPHLVEAALTALLHVANSSSIQNKLLLLPYISPLQQAYQRMKGLAGVGWAALHPEDGPAGFADWEHLHQVTALCEIWVKHIQAVVYNGASTVYCRNFPAIWRNYQEALVLFAAAYKSADASLWTDGSGRVSSSGSTFAGGCLAVRRAAGEKRVAAVAVPQQQVSSALVGLIVTDRLYQRLEKLKRDAKLSS